MDDTTDYTRMNRQEIIGDIRAALGDTFLPDAVCDCLVAELEDRDNVTPDEFWSLVEKEFGHYDNA